MIGEIGIEALTGSPLDHQPRPVDADTVFPSRSGIEGQRNAQRGLPTRAEIGQPGLQNWFAGLLLLVREPFRPGDQIVVAGYEGTVERVNARATTIKTYDGHRVVIPNSDIYTRPVTVKTAFDVARSVYDVGIGYGDNIEEARSAILEALDDVEGIAKNPRPEVIPWDLAGSSVNLRVRWWTQSPRIKVVLARGRVIKAIRDALTQAQIDMPYPTQVILFHDQTEESDGDRRRQREGWPAGRSPPRPRATAVNAPARTDEISSEGDL